MIDYLDNIGDSVLQQLSRKITIATVLVHREVMRAVRRHFVQRTGKLRKSWQLRVITRRKGGPSQLLGGAVVGMVSSDHPAAWIQNTGGRITSRRPMPIPMSEEAQGKRAKHFGDRLTVTAGGYLVEELAKTSIFHFILRHSVKLEATHYLDETARKASDILKRHGLEAVGIAVQGKGKS